MPQSLFLSLGFLFAAICLGFLVIESGEKAAFGGLSFAIMAASCFIASAQLYIGQLKNRKD